MTRKEIQVQYPVLDHSESVANIAITTTRIEATEGIKIKDAFNNKNNSLFIHINNYGASAGLLTVKAGDAYPNSMLGDITIEIPRGYSAIQLQDLSRFEKADGSLDLDFDDEFMGNIYAVAKWAGMRTYNG